MEDRPDAPCHSAVWIPVCNCSLVWLQSSSVKNRLGAYSLQSRAELFWDTADMGGVMQLVEIWALSKRPWLDPATLSWPWHGGDKPSGIWGLVFTTRPILFCLKKHLIHHPRGENILPLLLLRETSHYLCFRNMSPVRKPPHTIHCFKCLTESLMLFLFFVFSSEYSHFSNVLCLQT